MADDRFRKLTERQRECLRLILSGHEIKEIARDLGITPNAVTERLRTARLLLGVESSRDAARLLALHEGNGTYRSDVDMPLGLAVQAASPSISALSETRIGHVPNGLGVMEEAAIFEPIPLMPSRRGFPWPVPTKERPRNDLSPAERLVVSVVLTFLIAAVLGISTTAFVLLMRFLTDLTRHGG